MLAILSTAHGARFSPFTLWLSRQATEFLQGVIRPLIPIAPLALVVVSIDWLLTSPPAH